eukprot:scaffold2724_cov260-Pinguiococcus_pyrenoidosus.AAC.28
MRKRRGRLPPPFALGSGGILTGKPRCGGFVRPCHPEHEHEGAPDGLIGRVEIRLVTSKVLQKERGKSRDSSIRIKLSSQKAAEVRIAERQAGELQVLNAPGGESLLPLPAGQHLPQQYEGRLEEGQVVVVGQGSVVGELVGTSWDSGQARQEAESGDLARRGAWENAKGRCRVEAGCQDEPLAAIKKVTIDDLPHCPAPFAPRRLRPGRSIARHEPSEQAVPDESLRRL